MFKDQTSGWSCWSVCFPFQVLARRSKFCRPQSFPKKKYQDNAPNYKTANSTLVPRYCSPFLSMLRNVNY
jgi:hypothetical protein